MARKRKNEETDYKELIKTLKAEIDTATQIVSKNRAIISMKKKELKKAEKEYEIQQEREKVEKQEKEIHDLVQKLLDSGMSIEEIQDGLTKKEDVKVEK